MIHKFPYYNLMMADPGEGGGGGGGDDGGGTDPDTSPVNLILNGVDCGTIVDHGTVGQFFPEGATTIPDTETQRPVIDSWNHQARQNFKEIQAKILQLPGYLINFLELGDPNINYQNAVTSPLSGDQNYGDMSDVEFYNLLYTYFNEDSISTFPTKDLELYLNPVLWTTPPSLLYTYNQIEYDHSQSQASYMWTRIRELMSFGHPHFNGQYEPGPLQRQYEIVNPATPVIVTEVPAFDFKDEEEYEPCRMYWVAKCYAHLAEMEGYTLDGWPRSDYRLLTKGNQPITFETFPGMEEPGAWIGSGGSDGEEYGDYQAPTILELMDTALSQGVPRPVIPYRKSPFTVSFDDVLCEPFYDTAGNDGLYNLGQGQSVPDNPQPFQEGSDSRPAGRNFRMLPYPKQHNNAGDPSFFPNKGWAPGDMPSLEMIDAHNLSETAMMDEYGDTPNYEPTEFWPNQLSFPNSTYQKAFTKWQSHMLRYKYLGINNTSCTLNQFYIQDYDVAGVYEYGYDGFPTNHNNETWGANMEKWDEIYNLCSSDAQRRKAYIMRTRYSTTIPGNWGQNNGGTNTTIETIGNNLDYGNLILNPSNSPLVNPQDRFTPLGPPAPQGYDEVCGHSNYTNFFILGELQPDEDEPLPVGHNPYSFTNGFDINTHSELTIRGYNNSNLFNQWKQHLENNGTPYDSSSPSFNIGNLIQPSAEYIDRVLWKEFFATRNAALESSNQFLIYHNLQNSSETFTLEELAKIFASLTTEGWVSGGYTLQPDPVTGVLHSMYTSGQTQYSAEWNEENFTNPPNNQMQNVVNTYGPWEYLSQFDTSGDGKITAYELMLCWLDKFIIGWEAPGGHQPPLTNKQINNIKILTDVLYYSELRYLNQQNSESDSGYFGAYRIMCPIGATWTSAQGATDEEVLTQPNYIPNIDTSWRAMVEGGYGDWARLALLTLPSSAGGISQTQLQNLVFYMHLEGFVSWGNTTWQDYPGGDLLPPPESTDTEYGTFYQPMGYTLQPGLNEIVYYGPDFVGQSTWDEAQYLNDELFEGLHGAVESVRYGQASALLYTSQPITLPDGTTIEEGFYPSDINSGETVLHYGQTIQVLVRPQQPEFETMAFGSPISNVFGQWFNSGTTLWDMISTLRGPGGYNGATLDANADGSITLADGESLINIYNDYRPYQMILFAQQINQMGLIYQAFPPHGYSVNPLTPEEVEDWNLNQLPALYTNPAGAVKQFDEVGLFKSNRTRGYFKGNPGFGETDSTTFTTATGGTTTLPNSQGSNAQQNELGAKFITGNQIFTQSRNPSNDPYSYVITDGDPSNSDSEPVFSVSFGHIEGSGSRAKSYGKSAGYAVYKQWANTLLGTEDGEFFTISSSLRGSDLSPSDNVNSQGPVTTINPDRYIYVLASVKKGDNILDERDKPNWKITLSGSAVDGSGVTTSFVSDYLYNAGGTMQSNGLRRYNIVKGTDTENVASITPPTSASFGHFYPDMGVWVFNEMLVTHFGGQGSSDIAEFNKVGKSHNGLAINGRGKSDKEYNNALKFVNALRNNGSGKCIENLSYQNEEHLIYCITRLQSAEFNYTLNASRIQNNGEFKPFDGSMDFDENGETSPTTFPNAIQLYDSNGYLVAVGNLSTPIKKDFNSEVIIKVVVPT